MKCANIAVAIASAVILTGYGIPSDGKRPFAVFPDSCATPDGMAVDSKGRLVIAAPNFNDTTKPAAIFRLDEPGGEPYLWVHVPPLAKTGLAAPMGICFGPQGELYVCDNQGWSGSEKGANEGRLLRLDFKDDKLASCTVIARGMEHPNGVKYHNGMLYVTQSSLSKIKDPSGKLVSGVYRFKPTDSGIVVKNTREDPQLILTLVTQNPFCQYGLDGIVFDVKGNLLLGNFGDGTIHRATFDAAGNVTSCKVFAKTDFDYADPSAKDFLPRATKTKMRTTDGMCMDDDGNIYVADFSNNAIAKVSPNGTVSVVRQDPDGNGLDGGLNQPGEPIIWKGRLIVSNFDAVIGPDKVNTKKDPVCTLSEVALAPDGISFEGLSPIDAAAFSIERADKDGDRIYRFTEKSGTHAREIVVVPGDGLKAEAAVVRYPHGGTAERPFVENGKIYLTFAPGETLSLAWPKGGADKAATSAALPLRLPEIVGREQPARIVRREVVKQDGGAALAGAAWIWHPEAMQKKAVATLRTAFDIPEGAAIESAVLTFSLDNGGEVRLNGQVVGRQATDALSWKNLSVVGGGRGTARPVDLRALLKPGRNVLEATCDNFIPGDAGFIASLDMTVGGKKMRVFTNDRSWEASLDGKTFKRAKSAGTYGDWPWLRFDANGFASQKPLKKSFSTELTFDLGVSVPPGRLFFVGDGFRREVTSDLKPGVNTVSEARDVKNPRLIWTAPAQGVYDLRCEYLAEPMGVVRPRFFWKWAGERPEKWKISVVQCFPAGSCMSAKSDETAEHLYVEPSWGKTLLPFSRYAWFVGGPEGTEAGGSFVTGIEKWEKPFFKPPWKHDQKAYWIARKKVTLNGAKSVIVALASLGTHRLYVNGRPASDCFGPNRSHVEDGILLATTYDVTDLVRDGENEFKVYLHDGWAALGQCREKESCLSVDGRAVTTGGVVVIDSAEPWDVSLSADRSYGPLDYNCNGGQRGVEHLCDVERETRPARGVVRTGPAFTVSCDVADRDYAIREIKPVSIEETATPGKWKIDMGEAFSGFMRLRLSGKKGTVACMTASDTFVDECVFRQVSEFAFCGGDGVFENRMNTQSGRFFYLTGCEKPGLDDVTGIVIGCCGRIHGGFTGDRDLETILALDRDTFIATTMGGVTVDCPHRERLGYGEASLSAMWGDGMPQFDSAAYYYAYLLKWASSQRPDGSIPHVSPNGYGWGGTFWSNFPVYALADYCRRYPDARLKGIMRPVIDKWLDYLHAHVRPDGILAQYEPKKGDCLGDWAYPEVWSTGRGWGDWGHTVEGMFFNNCAYAWAIRRALETDGLITDSARRAELARRHAALVKAIERAWYKDGLYVSENARYQAIALLGGVAEAGGHRAETEKAMLDIVEWKGYIDGGSPSYMPILRLLCATRRGRELALRTFRRREAPGFLYFADEGYNTIPEAWHYGRTSHGSMIHTCYTGPAGGLFHGFAGIEIDGNKITVAPLLSDTLPNFSAYTETLYGTLYVKVESKGGRRVAWVLCPNGCEGRFIGGGTRRIRPGLNRFECPASASAAPCGDYVVAFDKTGGDDWKMVASALSRKHGAKILEYEGWSGLSGVLAELRKIKPRYVCFVVPPETARREFVAAAFRMMRLLDDDPYGDAIWGIITGYSAADGMRLVKAPPRREIRSLATSMGGNGTLDKWASGFASDERTADNFWMKRPGGANEKIATGGNIAKALADAFNSLPIDYFVTSGHATEHNWQIIYNQNKGGLVHTAIGGLQFVEPGGKSRHNLTNASLKVYIGAGNCLIGHVDRRVCMATAWMHAAGVEQFAGYTVPSWYGFMGWGVKGLYEEGRYSLAEARYLENERLLWAKTRKNKPVDEKGLDYDRDVFAYYGDPAQRIMFPEDTTPYKTVITGDSIEVTFTRDCSFAPLSDARGARPIVVLLDAPLSGNALLGADGKEVPDSVVTERYVFIPAPGKHAAGEVLKFRVSAK